MFMISIFKGSINRVHGATKMIKWSSSKFQGILNDFPKSQTTKYLNIYKTKKTV